MCYFFHMLERIIRTDFHIYHQPDLFEWPGRFGLGKFARKIIEIIGTCPANHDYRRAHGIIVIWPDSMGFIEIDWD